MANWSKYREKAEKANLLVVGAGGIGCELIKNLVLSGFVNLVVVSIISIFAELDHLYSLCIHSRIGS